MINLGQCKHYVPKGVAHENEKNRDCPKVGGFCKKNLKKLGKLEPCEFEAGIQKDCCEFEQKDIPIPTHQRVDTSACQIYDENHLPDRKDFDKSVHRFGDGK